MVRQAGARGGGRHTRPPVNIAEVSAGALRRGGVGDEQPIGKQRGYMRRQASGDDENCALDGWFPMWGAGCAQQAVAGPGAGRGVVGLTRSPTG